MTLTYGTLTQPRRSDIQRSADVSKILNYRYVSKNTLDTTAHSLIVEHTLLLLTCTFFHVDKGSLFGLGLKVFTEMEDSKVLVVPRVSIIYKHEEGYRRITNISDAGGVPLHVLKAYPDLVYQAVEWRKNSIDHADINLENFNKEYTYNDN